MKKQWLSIVLVLCMVLCLAPATARAEEDEKTCQLTITVGVNGLTGSAEGATFTFQIKRAINTTTALYNPYDKMTVTVGADGTTGTNTVSVAPGQYIVKQDVPGDPIGVLQTKVNRKNEKSPAKFTRPKMGITKQAGEKSHRQPG